MQSHASLKKCSCILRVAESGVRRAGRLTQLSYGVGAGISILLLESIFFSDELRFLTKWIAPLLCFFSGSGASSVAPAVGFTGLLVVESCAITLSTEPRH